MKVSSFYLNDISDYDDIIEYLTKTIEDKFFSIGKNSISVSRFISFLKKAIKCYIRLKYQKDISIIMTLPSIDEKLIYHDKKNDDIVKIRLSSDKIYGILDGNYTTFEDYIMEIIEQLDTELTSDCKFSFNSYLTTQLNNMVDVALMELKSTYSDEFLKNNIIKKESWIKLSQHSAVFKDYYIQYMENPKNKKLFFSFLKLLAVNL